MRPPQRKKHRRSPPSEPESSWTEAKVKAVLDAFVSLVGNAAKKHGVSASEVSALVRDHLLDPDPDG